VGRTEFLQQKERKGEGEKGGEGEKKKKGGKEVVL